MNLRKIETLPGSEKPSDLFQPYMPDVDLLLDMDALFSMARRQVASGCLPVEQEPPLPEGTRSIAIVTPGRMIMFVPGLVPGSQSSERLRQIQKILPSDKPLNIAVISYTYLEALMKDKSKCIPFLGYLLAFSYIGHNVVVFEGHPSAFASGVRNCDVLFVDSGMLPFMQKGWIKTAYQVMQPNPRIYIHNRESYNLSQIVRKEEGHQDSKSRKPWWKLW
ncbi:MAG TPA: hypothetical protein VKA60_09615 [Blastocatellia bacterium]|nr:hypothetical protein [Blastocatellia bacterium]